MSGLGDFTNIPSPLLCLLTSNQTKHEAGFKYKNWAIARLFGILMNQASFYEIGVTEWLWLCHKDE